MSNSNANCYNTTFLIPKFLKNKESAISQYQEIKEPLRLLLLSSSEKHVPKF